MKKVIVFSLIIVAVTVAVSCSDVQRNPGRVYMPDMAYSRAYETYATTEEQKAELLKRGIHFSNVPVAGTIKRDELLPFLTQKDSAAGDTSNYHASREVKNPLTSMDTVEAERLFLVNCAICHGVQRRRRPFPGQAGGLYGRRSISEHAGRADVLLRYLWKE
jgi:hypothetical protein